MINQVIEHLKESEVAISDDGSHLTFAGIPNWRTYMILLKYIQEITAVHVASSVFTGGVKIEPIKHIKGCAGCKLFRQYACVYNETNCGIPAAVMINGCEHFEQNCSVYF